MKQILSGREVRVARAIWVLALYFFAPSIGHSQWLTTLPNTGIQAIYWDPPFLFCATTTEEVSVYLSTDTGLTWEPCDYKIRGDNFDNFIQMGPKLFLAGAEAWGTFVSTDTGKSWTQVDYGVGYGVYQPVFCFASIGSALIAAQGTMGPLISRDTGNTWVLGSNGLMYYYTFDYGHSNPQVVFPGPLHTFGDTVFAASNLGLFYSLDTGIHWEPTDTNYFRSDSMILDMDSEELDYDSDLFINDVDTCGPYLFVASNSKGILRSSDRGHSWKWCGAGLPGKIWSLASWNHIIFCGSVGYDLFYSYDYGNTWIEDSTVPGSAITMAGPYLFTGNVEGPDGVWRRPLSDFGISSVVQPTTVNSSFTIFPNLATSSFTVCFANLSGVPIRYEIDDVLGRILASGETSGNQLSLSASELPAGVLLFRASGNGFVQTRPFVVAR